MSGADRDGDHAEDARLLALARSAIGSKTSSVVGVAVSGGGDSVALLHLMKRVQAETGGSVRAVTVDHQLRPDSAVEARIVADLCARLGISHDTVSWEHGPVSGNIPDQARRARYALIADWARREGVGHVVIGHTADDQAETFLMELAREAGIDGLASMRGAWRSGGIYWSRPLLSATRTSLRAYLRRHGIGWVDDPTNEDDSYQRVKARRALAALAPLGITVEGIAHVADNLSLARGDLVALAWRAALEIATESAGEVVFDQAKWRGVGKETGRRLVIAALRWVSSAGHAPRAAEIARMEEAIWHGRDATLGGCHVRAGEAEVRFAREPRAVAGIETPTDATWDNRWRLTGPHDPTLTVRALGADGLRQCENWRETGHSKAALIVSPAIWRGDTLVAAPLAGLENGWTGEIVAGFHSFLLSH